MEEFETVPDSSQGVLEGVNFDLRRFSFILGLLPSGGELLVWDWTKEVGVKSLGFEIGPWRGCLGGVAGESSECSNVFKMEPEKCLFKGLGVKSPPKESEEDPFELLMSLESE